VEMAWCVRAYLPSTKHDTDKVTGFCVVPTLKVFPLFSPCCCVFTFLFFFLWWIPNRGSSDKYDLDVLITSNKSLNDMGFLVIARACIAFLDLG
jgi:hypothetical protein